MMSTPPGFASSSYPMLDNMGSLPDARPYPQHAHDNGDFHMPADYNPTHHDMGHDQLQHDDLQYSDPSGVMPDGNQYHEVLPIVGDVSDQKFQMPPQIPDATPESDAESNSRAKSVVKPAREVTKDTNGRFYCAYPGCTEDIKQFGRKCEWNKHMDKHDRPYKCLAEGCEKLPGFTYSGGLLRHEREVHNKHGGPKKQLNCPHQNCKRYEGKGFSRQENLNEHLRRVHTGIETENVHKEADGQEDGDAQVGEKRRRNDADDEVQQEVKRLRAENEELRQQLNQQTITTNEMAHQIHQLQNQSIQLSQTQLHQVLQQAAAGGHGRMVAPAPML